MVDKVGWKGKRKPMATQHACGSRGDQCVTRALP